MRWVYISEDGERNRFLEIFMLFADCFLDGNFRLPATHFMAAVLDHYAFYISQLSPMGMVRIHHFEFV
ncbi:hypothetical protein Hanom_Chr01g00048771 [Helianthus anomalus]